MLVSHITPTVGARVSPARRFPDPRRVLIIRTSNAAFSSLSASVSDWYAQARGLGTDYLWLDFDFGNCTEAQPLVTRDALARRTAGTAIFNGASPIVLDRAADGSGGLLCTAQSARVQTTEVGRNVFLAIARVVETFGVQALLVTPGVPSGVFGPFIGSQSAPTILYPQATEVVLAWAPYYATRAAGSAINATVRPASLNSADYRHGTLNTSGSAGTITASGASRADPPLRAVAPDRVMPGRIGAEYGYATGGGATVFSTLSEVQAMVNNAMAAELTDNLDRLHVIGGSAYIYGGGVHNSVAANRAARDLGVRALAYVGNSPPGVGDAERAAWGSGPTWLGDGGIAHTSTGPRYLRSAAPSAGPMTVRVTHHAMGYTWEGVIGNSTATPGNLSILKSFLPANSVMPVGSALYLSLGYNEGQSVFNAVTLANPQQSIGSPTLVDPWSSPVCSCADATRIYWASAGGLPVAGTDSPASFVAAHGIASNSREGFTLGTTVNLNGSFSSQIHPNVLHYRANLSSPPTGIAVQQSGTVLAVAYGREGAVRLNHKTTGAVLGRIAIATEAPAGLVPNQLAFAPDSNLWILEEARALRVAPANLATPTPVITGLVSPLAICVDPADSNRVWIAEGGTRQQVRCYSAANGAVLATFGQAGGMRSDPAFAADRLCFHGFEAREQTSIAVDQAGSLWVCDPGNCRIVERRSNGTVGAVIAWLPATYCTPVDLGNPRRVFCNFLEFDVDDVAAQHPSASWRVVRNWLPSLPAGLRAANNWHNRGAAGFNTVVTIGARTMAQLEVGGQQVFVELPASGPAVAITTAPAWPGYAAGYSPYGLTAEGHLVCQRVTGGEVVVLRHRLLSWGAGQQPQWEAQAQVIATTPSLAPGDPVQPSGTFTGWAPMAFPVTADGRVVLYSAAVSANTRWHLGAVRQGGSQWTMRALPSGDLYDRLSSALIRGQFPTQRQPQQSVEYGGNVARLAGRHLFLGYHGEKWTDFGRGVGQASQVFHYRDDGMYLGQFGTPTTRRTQAVEPGVSGNAVSLWAVAGSTGPVVYHNDESEWGGVHRWRLTGSSDVVDIDQTFATTSGERTFTFSLPGTRTTSAAVFGADGSLVRILWNGVTLGAGSHTRAWDGQDFEGRAAGAQLRPFAVAAALAHEAPYDGPLAAGLTFQAGGWAKSWMSDSRQLGMWALRNGASLAFAVVFEPFEDNVADLDSVVTLLLQGRTALEAAYLSTNATSGNSRGSALQRSNVVMVPVGDPLYAPYRATRRVE